MSGRPAGVGGLRQGPRHAWRKDTLRLIGIIFDAEATGRPLGAPEFVARLEMLLGRKIARRAPGQKPASDTPPGEQLKLL